MSLVRVQVPSLWKNAAFVPEPNAQANHLVDCVVPFN